MNKSLSINEQIVSINEKKEKKKIIKNERKSLLELKYNFKEQKLSPRKEKKKTGTKKEEN